MDRDALALAFEQFVADNDEPAFLTMVEQHGGFAPLDVEFPVSHRIRDVSLFGNAYRIVRVYDIDDRTSRLYVFPTNSPGEQLGVPYELQGRALHKWVVDELDNPTDDDTDWKPYLDMMDQA